MLLVASAFAADMTWSCGPVAAPADALAWAPASDPGGAAAGSSAEDTLFAYVDDACVADCADPWQECAVRTCVTEAGDVVTYEAVYTFDWDTTWQRTETVITVRVEPVDASLGWEWGEVVRTASGYSASGSAWSSGTGWSVSWGGRLRDDWPTDASFRAGHSDSYEGSEESWDDGVCAWQWYTRPWGQYVMVDSASVHVSDMGQTRSCNGLWDYEIGGGLAYLDEVKYGYVDLDTWERVAGTDADADGWTVEAGDCDDADPAAYCWAVELTDDGVDQDCDGVDLAGAPDTGDTGSGDTASPADTGDTAATDTASSSVDTAEKTEPPPAPAPRADTEAGRGCSTIRSMPTLGFMLALLPIGRRRSAPTPRPRV
jgi:hypothetical protein